MTRIGDRMHALVVGSSHLLVWHITLVSNQNLVDTLAGMLLNVGEPVANVFLRRISVQESRDIVLAVFFEQREVSLPSTTLHT